MNREAAVFVWPTTAVATARMTSTSAAGNAQVHDRDREAARQADPLQRPDERVEHEREQRRDEEEEDDVSRRASQGSRSRTSSSGSPTSCTQRGTCTRGGRPEVVMSVDATARIRRFSPPNWDWSFELDGALALDRGELVGRAGAAEPGRAGASVLR